MPKLKSLPNECVSSEGLVCPHCRHLHDDTDEMGDYITWTGDGPEEFDCTKCARVFHVTEHVTRMWTTKPLDI